MPTSPVPTHQSPPARTPALAYRLACVGLLLSAFALRLWQLGAESLWYDETVSAYLAMQSVPELVAHTARDIHPPGYYMLLHGWQAFSQPSVAFGLEFLYAWPGVWLDLIVLALTFAIANRVFGRASALWALALAAIHPTQFWFAQEVRMYALGALCVMLTLWSVSNLLSNHRANAAQAMHLPLSMRVIYPVAALLGLYTLYYFIFWLIALNLGIIILLWPYRRRLRGWLLLQGVVALGWLPWLPIFVRQATNPPVPTWRVEWQTTVEMFAAFSEALAAVWNAHALPLNTTWPWSLLIAVLAIAFFVYAKTNQELRWIWLLLAFGPLLMLYGISLAGIPIYHVRYVATYAPVFVLLIAATMPNLHRWAAAGATLILLAISMLAIRQLFSDPRFAADDHRTAVATLAEQWRPGDAILVNAGWVYTALATYWPHELASPADTRPPALSGRVRLLPDQVASLPNVHDQPLLLVTGSVDGEPSLGWGLPESDFFAVSADDTLSALETISRTYARIWHYRLYDTVSDPNGVIRAWLGDNTALTSSQAIPGRDFLLLENYRTGYTPIDAAPATTLASIPDMQLALTGSTMPSLEAAGETLYVDLLWQHQPATDPSQVALSLRLVDLRGNVISQKDVPLELTSATISRQLLALPIPADTTPGQYAVVLVVYAPATLAPYPLALPGGTTSDSALLLGNTTIELPQTLPHVGPILASFDYIDLASSKVPTSPLSPGGTISLDFTWRPRASDYRDHYRARLNLVDSQGQTLSIGEFDLGAQWYPSSAWPANFPLRQRAQVALPMSLAVGDFALHLAIYRASDGQAIPARLPWHLRPVDTLEIGKVQIQP